MKTKIILFFLLCAGIKTFSQELLFGHLKNEDGLSQNVVTCITQDDLGLMWFGTEDGLNVYDGYKFNVYRHDEEDSTSIAGNHIECLLFDTKNRLWCGTINRGLSLYDRNFDKWISFSFNNQNRASLSNNNIRDIVEGPDGNIYIGTAGGGINIINPDTYTIDKLDFSVNGQSIENLVVYSLCFENDSTIWLGSKGLVYSVNINNKTAYVVPFVKDEKKNKIIDPIRKIHKDKRGILWVATEFSGLYKATEYNNLTYYALKNNVESIDNIRTIAEDSDGLIYIGLDGAGLGRLDPIRQSFTLFQHQLYNERSLSNNAVYSVFESNEGTLWVGNYGGGINYANKLNNNLILFQSNLYSDNCLSSNYVRTICEDSDANIWIGTRFGLNSYNPKTDKFSYYAIPSELVAGNASNNILSIYEDSEGLIWIGTFSGGVNMFNKKTGEFKNYSNNVNHVNSLSNNNVYSILEDKENFLWFGTLDGLNRFDRKTGQWDRFEMSTIKYLYEDSQSRMLVGSGVLSLFNKDDGTFERIWPQKGPSVQVMGIIEDKNHNIWVGTKGRGLLKFSRDLELIETYSEKKGFPNEIINTIVEDSQGNLWVSTNKGIMRFNPQTEEMRVFDSKDGLQGNEFNPNCGLLSSDGYLYFGGNNGLNRFSPDFQANYQEESRILVAKLRLFNKQTKIGVDDSPLKKNILVTDTLIFQHKHTVITFDFVALNYHEIKNNQYQYKLEGFDNMWNSVGSQNSATYTNLPHGKYLLRIRTSVSGYEWDVNEKNLVVIMKPPYWKTNVAYVVYFLVFFMLLLTFKRYAIVPVKIKNDLLIQKIEREKYDELNQMKLAFFTNISHEFRTPLTLIIGPLDKILKNEQLDANLIKQLLIMQRNAKRLLLMVNQIMDFRKIDLNKMQLKLQKSDIVSFIKLTFLSFESLARNRELKYNFFSEIDSVITWFDNDAIEKIMYNFLSNAFKFTPVQNAEISVFVTLRHEPFSRMSIRRRLTKNKHQFESFIQVVVKDNGIGMDKATQERVFDRFFSSDLNSLQKGEGSGIGLAIAKSYIELHMGEVWVESESGKGSRFYFKIPVIEDRIKRGNNLIFDKTQAVERHLRNKDASDFESLVPMIIESDEVDLSNTLVLIIDDNIDLREFIKSSIEGNYSFLEASNGAEGLDIAINKLPDIIICDVMMPVMDGIEFCNEVKKHKNTCHIPVILLTAKSSKEYTAEGLLTGADDYITKPFDPDILAIRIENLLRSRAKLKEIFSKGVTFEPSQNILPSQDEKLFSKIMELLETNIDDSNFGVSELVNQLGVSRPVLYRKMKALTDLSVVDFIKHFKIKKAAAYLSQGNVTVSEVAYAVGFNDPKHFSKKFKEINGMSPKDYIRNNSK